MPLLAKRRPDIHLSVYGSNMPKSFKEYETENIRMIGFTESLDEVFHTTRVFVVPLLSGAGIKGKVLESMAYGVPAVLSAVAAEGTGLTDEIGALFAKKPEEWVEAIIRLYDDREQWNKLAENAQLLARTQFSFEHCRQRFQDIFAGVGLYSTR
jgi:glycosyltransferase involved in cell wall biosynthesis